MMMPKMMTAAAVVGLGLALAPAGHAGMFSTSPPPQDDRKAQYEAQKKLIDALEEKAKAAEPDALAQADELAARFAADYRDEAAGFKFEVRRWGNFLEVSIARVADKPGEPQRTHSIAISIPDMTTMKLTPGHEPDRGGTLRYRWSERPVSGAASGDHLVSLGSSTLSNSSGPDPKLTADELDILPSFPKVPTRAFVDEPAKPAQCYSTSLTSTNCSSNVVVMTSWSGYGDRTLSLKTEGYPRPSEDDAIELPKVGMRIYAPAGMGRGVYEQIMLATAKDRAAP